MARRIELTNNRNETDGLGETIRRTTVFIRLATTGEARFRQEMGELFAQYASWCEDKAGEGSSLEQHVGLNIREVWRNDSGRAREFSARATKIEGLGLRGRLILAWYAAELMMIKDNG